MFASLNSFLYFFFFLQCSFLFSQSLIHHLKLRDDDRNVFKIETFGFITGGSIQLMISDLIIKAPIRPTPPPALQHTNSSSISSSSSKLNKTDDKVKNNNNNNNKEYNIGLLMRHANSESDAQQDLEMSIEKNECVLNQEKLTSKDIFIDLSDPKSWKKTFVTHEITSDNVGLYSLIFARCLPTGFHYTSFNLDATFTNPGPNYLSAGDIPLPKVYLIFFFLYGIALGVWIWVLQRNPQQYGTVHRIHYMMLILLTFKVLSILFDSIRYHYIAIFGSSEAWSILYYIFTFLKGVMLFTVILLIGSGYSLMKNYLHDREKQIIFVVGCLQVLDNIAMIVLEETAPGSQGWLTWRDILHILDIICCLAILLPIVWSIKHLRQAAEVDGKAQHSLVKLQLFRTFYVIVVVYIYFTRIAVYLLAATVPYYLLWVGDVSTETATFIFFVLTGYKFRPAIDNPYFAVSTEDTEADNEYGLTENDDEEVIIGTAINLSTIKK